MSLDPTRSQRSWSARLAGVADSTAAFDALADVFLGGPTLPRGAAPNRPEPERPSPPPTRPLRLSDLEMPERPSATSTPAPGANRRESVAPTIGVELVIVGHLPGIAASWVRAYARTVALRGRPVALARCTRDLLRVERFGGSDGSVQVRTDVDLDDDARAQDEASAGEAPLGEALAALSAQGVRHVLLAVGDGEETSAACQAGVARITVLTGADQTATIAAYRRIKGIAEVLSAAAPAAERPRVHIVVVGAAEVEAQGTLARLTSAADAHLHVHLVAAPSIAQVSAALQVLSTPVFEGMLSVTTAQLVANLDATTRGVHGEQTEFLPQRNHENAARESGAESEDEAAKVEQGSHAGVDDLWSLIPGLTPLPFRAPLAPQVQFAADANGRLHALTHAGDGMLGVAHLMCAAGWVRANLATLRLTGDRTLSDGPVVTHLFTREPATARGLLDADVRVHALISATRPGFVTCLLN